MLTQKIVGFTSESTTLLQMKGNGYAGLACTGKFFRAIGLCPEGIFIEAHGQREIIKAGRFSKLYLRITNDCRQNRHQFSYSTDGRRYTDAGDDFTMRSGYWKGIRLGLFCYGTDAVAQFDFFQYRESN